MPYKNKAKAKECKRRFQLGNSQRCKDAHSRWVDRDEHDQLHPYSTILTWCGREAPLSHTPTGETRW